MKKLLLYTVSTAILLSCSKLQEEFPASSHCLQVEVDLLSSPQWATRAVGNAIAYGNSAEIGEGDYIITAQKEDWNAHSTTQSGTSVADGPLTRGIPITSATAIAKLRINVFKTDADDWSEASTLTAALDATNKAGNYTVSPAYSWVASPSVKTSLFAYSPLPTVDNGLVDAPPTQIVYTVPDNVPQQPDLCVAKPTMNVINSDGIQQNRTFTLSHQLTAVGFAMLGWNAKITEITVSGIANKGTLTMNPTGEPTWTLDPAGTTGSYKVGVTQTSYQHSPTNSYANITTSDGYLMMIPQTLGNEAKVTITYESTGDGSTGGTLTANLNDLGITWEAGDKVTYNIRLKTAPAVTTGDMLLAGSIKGYTTISPMTLVMDRYDELTFTWDEPWLKIHKGDPKEGDVTGGMMSPWLPGKGGPWANVYFFATEDNASNAIDRIATVTVSGTRSGTKTFTVKQPRRKPNSNQIYKIDNLYWTGDNLIADGKNGCQVGDGNGLYFQFGSLVGWSGGADGSGAGQSNNVALYQRVTPRGYTGTKNWPAPVFKGGTTTTGYGLPATDDPVRGIGDACRYYLGPTWRIPTADEYTQLTSAGRVGGLLDFNPPITGRWLGPNPRPATGALIFLTTGLRQYDNGKLLDVYSGAHYWSSSVYSSYSAGYYLYFTEKNFNSKNYTLNEWGMPLRCVSENP